MERYTNPDCKPEMEELMKDCPRSRSGAECWLRLRAIEDILGDEYDLDRLREMVELTKNIPHVCRFCVGCEMEPKDGHGCDKYDSFVFSTRRLRELVQSDRDGRCVVLPCKIGDPVWRLYDDCDFPGDCYTKQKCGGCEYRNLFIEEQAFCLSMLSQNGKLDPPYYTTLAEAEAALRREQDG